METFLEGFCQPGCSRYQKDKALCGVFPLLHFILIDKKKEKRGSCRGWCRVTHATLSGDKLWNLSMSELLPSARLLLGRGSGLQWKQEAFRYRDTPPHTLSPWWTLKSENKQSAGAGHMWWLQKYLALLKDQLMEGLMRSQISEHQYRSACSFFIVTLDIIP